MKGETFEKVRKIVLIGMAFFSDAYPECGELVFKGGSALEMFYNHPRHSRDMDFSIPDIISEDKLEECKKWLEQTLIETFSEQNFKVTRFRWDEQTPHKRHEGIPFFRGHKIVVDVIDIQKYEMLKNKYRDRSSSFKRALNDPNNIIKCEIQISEMEYTEHSEIREVEGVIVKVYSPVMIVSEKLRAICQHTPSYYLHILGRGVDNLSPRVRDFYDIYKVCERYKINWKDPTNLEILEAIFKVKKVPLDFLKNLDTDEIRSMHFNKGEYQKLKDTVKEREIKEFDFYYNYVVKLAREIWDNVTSTLDHN